MFVVWCSGSVAMLPVIVMMSLMLVPSAPGPLPGGAVADGLAPSVARTDRPRSGRRRVPGRIARMRRLWTRGARYAAYSAKRARTLLTFGTATARQ
ncbi:hypothetical protein GCM10010921_10130 [Microbacterium album]|uniref:Uncharacterized protein n=1 Tax=Microbacterium album TaxID=2053191 RepID=A0A917IEQ7_9MICO|nr:hypothetical protein GCM10010921_10130 [Microbacterium album]